MCGDLVRKMDMKEPFLSDMMYNGVLSLDKKKDIQMVCEFVLIRLICQCSRRNSVRPTTVDKAFLVGHDM